MAKSAWLLSLVLFAVGCGKTPAQKLTALSEEFVYGSLAFSPSASTATGLHRYQKQNLDEMLDDFGEQSLYKQRTFYEKFRDRLGDLQTGDLTPEDRADLTILQNQIALNLLDLNEIHSHQHAPQLYVETLGNALFAPYVLEYVRGEESVAQRFHVQLRRVLVAVDFVQVEQVERNLVLQDGEVGAVFRGQVAGLEIAQAVAELLVESTLFVEALLAKVVQHLVQVLLLVPMQARRGGRRGGKGEGTIDELLGKCGELLGGSFAATNGE